MSTYTQFVILLLLNLALSQAQISQLGAVNTKDKREPARFYDTYDRNKVASSGMKDYNDYNFGQQYEFTNPYNNPYNPYNPHHSESDYWKQTYAGNMNPHTNQKPSYNDGSYHDYQNQQLKHNNSPHYNQYPYHHHNFPNQGPYAYPYGHSAYNHQLNPQQSTLTNKSGQSTYPGNKQPGYFQQNLGLAQQQRLRGSDNSGYSSKQPNYASTALGYQQQAAYQPQSNYGSQKRQQAFPQQGTFGYPQQSEYGYNQK